METHESYTLEIDATQCTVQRAIISRGDGQKVWWFRIEDKASGEVLATATAARYVQAYGIALRNAERKLSK